MADTNTTTPVADATPPATPQPKKKVVQKFRVMADALVRPNDSGFFSKDDVVTRAQLEQAGINFEFVSGLNALEDLGMRPV